MSEKMVQRNKKVYMENFHNMIFLFLLEYGIIKKECMILKIY